MSGAGGRRCRKIDPPERAASPTVGLPDSPFSCYYHAL